ncbi:ATP-binding protein [Paenibacillus lemnae]|uniref:Circadian input-output histidine kinase CikA n=1 Tax=Paenibacillus lemnae TaxID=1330551 RepID=A0A848M3W2_PAELE|nr:ATP-binding protein [Paenibacillus lemnae]NMO94513.1 response regulator [Paenibacillus lemnae]
MHDPQTEAAMLRRTIEQLSDQIVRARESEEQVLSEFSAMNNELVTLQRQLSKSNAQLKKARMEAEQAVEVKSSLLALMSHEIRTPINAIMGLAEMIEQPDLTEENQASLTIIRESASHLVNMINDLLDLSKVDAGKMELKPEPFELKSVLDHVSGLLEGKIRGRGNSLSIYVDPKVNLNLIGDPGRITQILLNLVGNANKFTDKGQLSIRVMLIGDQDVQQELRFEIQDTGMGISSEDQAMLFKPYTQTGKGSSQEFGGTGLGLSISKSFVELMKGEIGVHSEEGQGALFWFQIILPKVREATPKRMVKETSGVQLSRNKLDLSAPVLLVEDNSINRQVVLMQLRKLGLTSIDSAQDGVEAFKKAEAKAYRLVIMDHMMPRMSGIEAAAKIRAAELELGRKRAPIIALTGSTDESDRQRCTEAGMDQVLAKPVNLESLAAMLEQYLPKAVKPLEEKVLDQEVIRDIIDINEDGSHELLNLLTDMYQQEMPGKMEQLQKLLDNEDAAGAAASAHDMKSGSLSLGIYSLSVLLSDIESAAKAGRLDDCRDMFSQLQPAYEKACDSLNRILNNEE